MSIIEHPRGPRIGPGVAVGVTEQVIRTQVHTFYGRVRQDEILGPIFNAAVEDWDDHLAKLCDFWSSVLLATGRFKGSPMMAHARTPGVVVEHLSRWLDLWQDTARKVCRPEAADLFIAKAELIGESLKLGLAVSRGQIPSF